jgi:hypothetical protein
VTSRIFLLSPARADGQRMQMLRRPAAQFALALKLKRGEATLGECFEFASGLYFRGKRAYARAFGSAPMGLPAALVIAPGAGLVPEDARVTLEQLAALGQVPVDENEPRFIEPLLQSVRILDEALGGAAEVVLLGSVASSKYVTPLLGHFGARLLFPGDFVGRGDMSRGGLLLRCVREKKELGYLPVAGAVLHGKRPPKLPRLK